MHKDAPHLYGTSPALPPILVAPEGGISHADVTDPEEVAARPRIVLPAVLLVATCASTFFAGATNWSPFNYVDSFDRAGTMLWQHWQQGLIYMVAVLAILGSHEMGHFLVAMRNRIPVSLPYFLPFPVSPLGTLGAVIGMQGRMRADRRQLFDVGLAGPLAGLVVALPILWIGFHQYDPLATSRDSLQLPSPLLFQIVLRWLHPDCPPGSFAHLSALNPFLAAGWAAMLVTGLNMLPVSQLDGGHVAHALLGRRSVWLARGLLVGSILFILVTNQYNWALMVILVTLIGVDHPPTADDQARLGWPRRLVGWVSLAIPILCLPSMHLA
jgi:membrane-associated protease RseP (regulator of RpoE activity)